jgi:hypothetical protein
MILKIVNVDKSFVRTCERSNTFTNADERSQKINVNVQNSTYNVKRLSTLKFAGKLKNLDTNRFFYTKQIG